MLHFLTLWILSVKPNNVNVHHLKHFLKPYMNSLKISPYSLESTCLLSPFIVKQNTEEILTACWSHKADLTHVHLSVSCISENSVTCPFCYIV